MGEFETQNETESEQIFEMYFRNRRVTGPALYFLIIAYSILIFFGVCGNILVVWVVLRKPTMRTARNLFILNLAVSDLLLCLVTMPFTLMQIVTRYWPLGDNVFSCKMIGTSHGIITFVSTFSITAIALDRYQLIVNPTRDSLKGSGVLIVIFIIWVISVICACPIFIFKTLVIPENTTMIIQHLNLDNLAFCIEDWPIDHGRGIYSGVSLIFQYVLPILTISVAYWQICRKLQYRQVAARASQTRRRSRDERRRRTNWLLVAIAVVYYVSWLPLNVYNVLQDFDNQFGEDHQRMMVVYAVCHMAGMSSACSNPILYGWLNDNFRKEFKEILGIFCLVPAGSGGPSWLGSLRCSFKSPKTKSKSSSSCEKISMKVKAQLSGVEEASLYIDELNSKVDDCNKVKKNVTMTTSLDCDYAPAEEEEEEEELEEVEENVEENQKDKSETMQRDKLME